MGENSFADSNFDHGYDLEKLEATSPTGGHHFTFSRTSSTGSVHTSSSAHNTGEPSSSTDDDDSDAKSTQTYKDRRREAHTQAEQKRRDAIKKGYDDLQLIVPTCQQSEGSQKLSKATVLQKSIDYIQFLIQQKKKQEEDLDSLKKEVIALEIMKSNYEQIVKAHQNQPPLGHNQVSDEIKFKVFQTFMDSQFQTFNAAISVTDFKELSACVFTWLEEYCKPQSIHDLMVGILRQINIS